MTMCGQVTYADLCTAKRDKTHLADFGKTAMPIATLGITLLKRDWVGAGVFEVTRVSFYSLNRPLEKWFDQRRPCGCMGAFPSGHMIVYATSSSFLHYRYGWRYGLPAYVGTVVFAANRVHNKAHTWKNMAGTFAAVNAMTYGIVWMTRKYIDQSKWIMGVTPEAAMLSDDFFFGVACRF